MSGRVYKQYTSWSVFIEIQDPRVLRASVLNLNGRSPIPLKTQGFYSWDEIAQRNILKLKDLQTSRIIVVKY